MKKSTHFIVLAVLTALFATSCATASKVKKSYHAELSANPLAIKQHKEYCTHFIRFFYAAMHETGDQPPHDTRIDYAHSQAEVSPKTRMDIQDTILTVRNSIVDVNGDGKINCVDYATMFYLAYYTFVNKDLELVQNVQPGIMNHLFVQVRDQETGKWIEVEPWTYDIDDFMMYRCWSISNYDYEYNMYNVTNKWLSRCVHCAYAFERYKR